MVDARSSLIGWTLYVSHNEHRDFDWASDVYVGLCSPKWIEEYGVDHCHSSRHKGKVLMKMVIDESSPLSKTKPADLAKYIDQTMESEWGDKENLYGLVSSHGTVDCLEEDYHPEPIKIPKNIAEAYNWPESIETQKPDNPYIKFMYKSDGIKNGPKWLAARLECLVADGLPEEI